MSLRGFLGTVYRRVVRYALAMNNPSVPPAVFQSLASIPAPGFPAVETFDFVLEDNKKAFRLVGTTPGIVVLGAGRRQ